MVPRTHTCSADTELRESSDYTPLVNIIGIHFQVRDDYMNLQSTSVCIKTLVVSQEEMLMPEFVVHKQQGLL